jgi:hypothetical protein
MVNDLRDDVADLQARLDFRVLTLDRYRAQRELDKETIADLQARLAAAERAKEVMAKVLGETSGRLSDAQVRAERLAALLSDVWTSVPANFNPTDPMVIRHAAILNTIPAALSPEAHS